MKKLLSILVMLAALFSAAQANDGVYFTSGNFLVPTKETDISVKKEILTITIGKDSLATVDVYYEFMNNGDAKRVTMAFEAASPYNAAEPLQHNGVHPDIKDFTVVMNDQPLNYQNGVVAVHWEESGRQVDLTPLDMTKWKGYGEVADTIVPMDDVIYNAEMDSTVAFAYGYFFTADFRPGLNVVHHTYTFKMSFNVASKFEIPYWLTPATRWANHQVDDFTLRIKSEDMREFCMADTVFADAPFKLVGDGEFYQMKLMSGEHFLYARLGQDGMLEWHKENFCPKYDMQIGDAKAIIGMFGNSTEVVIDKDGNEYRFIGDCGDSYLVSAQDYAQIPKAGCKVVEYSADNGKGWVFPKEVGTYNVRTVPNTKSAVIGRIKFEEGEMPEGFRCLGWDLIHNDWWYKINYKGRTAYVAGLYFDWDAINPY